MTNSKDTIKMIAKSFEDMLEDWDLVTYRGEGSILANMPRPKIKEDQYVFTVIFRMKKK